MIAPTNINIEIAAAPPDGTHSHIADPRSVHARDVSALSHDFGYRNFGNGLRLDRTEARRAWVDGRLLAGLRQVCAERYRSVRLALCRAKARLMWAAVRTFNDWSG